jgi:hypothetical protein
MRSFKFLVSFLAVMIVLLGCQKEYSLELGLSEGTLKMDGAGGCLPSTINGIYKEDSVLNNTNYIDVQVNIVETGTYIIKSDTVNGFSFYGSGTLDNPGLNNVRLFAHGTPVDPGVNTFTIMYDSSSCFVDVTVITVGPPGVYSLAGNGSSCTGAVLNGTYTVGIPAIPGNTVTLNVDVTTIGSYTISTPVVNGVSFSGIGDFTTTGPQTVSLNATGTPAAAGDFNYPATANSSSCTFTVTYAGPAGPAAYTLGGAGAACTGVVLAGTYNAGTAMTAGNTATIEVNVTAIGSYAISTTAANGVTFSKMGNFTNTGAQTVTLVASGIPTASGTITHTVNGSPGTCTFQVTYTSGTPPPGGVCTLAGAPGACTGATIAGTYTVGTPLTAANTATVTVNVTTVGPYTISTNTVNGITFSKSGTFTTLGTQTVVLNGTGTPAAAGTNTFTVTAGTSTCTFTVTTTTAGPANFINATIDGVAFTFNDEANASYPATDVLLVFGYENPNDDEAFALAIESLNGQPIAVGTYTMAGSSATTYQLYAEYTDPTGTIFWDPSDGTVLPKDPFTITITSINATRVSGTFSGTLRNDAGNGPQTKIITNGSFSVPF